ncbi:uncharacterized protein LOC123880127 [Maniola jurtina]|uniref:uncharacterized protein LOC123880127 n=1 Tax=Maniola jurtina TaxID=191418 RepID=UPI001E68E8DA|nr:uncharacterized protein LOC123880127 [Maniola jurtina]
MMLIKIFLVCLMLSGCCSADMDVFESLYEAQEQGGKAMACVSDISYKNPRSCPGVLWRQSWLLVRASCLKYASDTYVQKGISNCTRNNSTITPSNPQCDEEKCIRFITAVYMHPRFPAIDLAMLRLNAPFSTETHAFSYDLELKLDNWEKFITDYYSTTTEGNIQIRHYQMYTTPVKMFVITVVLPTVSFALFFLYVVFYTGSSDKVLGIPYTNLTNKEENQKCN